MVLAHTTIETYRNCDAEDPLPPDDDAYVDLAKARGQRRTFAERITFTVEGMTTKGDATHVGLISGHRGCGKSTELLRVLGALEAEGWAVAWFDAFAVLDENDMDAPDIVIALCEAVARLALVDGKGFDDRSLRLVYDYFAKEEIVRESKRLVEADVEAEAKLSGGIPTIFSLFARFRGNMKGSEEIRNAYRREVQKDFSNFAARVRTLVQSAEQSLIAAGKRGLVAMVDSLEKIPNTATAEGVSKHEQIFQVQAPILKCPPCRVFYTVPITLTAEELLSNVFGDPPLIVPMIDLHLPEAHACLCEVLERRVDFATVFEPGTDLRRFVEASGGCIRDLLRLVRTAVHAETAPVPEEQVDYAIDALTKEYDRLFNDDDIPTIVQCARTGRVDYDERGRKLLYRRVVLEYENGVRRMEPHPLVLRNARVQRALLPPPQEPKLGI